MKKIVLNEAEILIANYIGMARYNNARTLEIVDQKVGDQPNAFVDINGMGGELAACRVFNVYPDLTIVEADKLPGYDFIAKNGAKVDVKTTEYKTGKLLATLKTEIGAANVYLLVTGVLPKYTIVGYCAEEKLLDAANIGDLGKGKGYMLDQEFLTSVG